MYTLSLTVAPDYVDYAHVGPGFFTWHRMYHLLFENEIQAMLQTMGRVDYHKFRFPYWDWRGEIQRSYGLPSEELFTFNRLGETRNVSNRPVVFGDLVGDDWNAICLGKFGVLCDPKNAVSPLQRCPFTGNPNLCHSSNPDWPTMQEVNKVLTFNDYEVPPFNLSAINSLRGYADFFLPSSIEECREDIYCQCIPGGLQCEEQPDNTSVIAIDLGIHSKVRKSFLYCEDTL